MLLFDLFSLGMDLFDFDLVFSPGQQPHVASMAFIVLVDETF